MRINPVKLLEEELLCSISLVPDATKPMEVAEAGRIAVVEAGPRSQVAGVVAPATAPQNTANACAARKTVRPVENVAC